MATFKTFEEIEAWQKGRELAKAIYMATKQPEFIKDFALRDQIRRASVSVISNIAEGFARGGNAEFVQFLSVARGSVAEIQAQLFIAKDLEYINDDDFARLFRIADETGRLLVVLINYLRKTPLKGAKFK